MSPKYRAAARPRISLLRCGSPLPRATWRYAKKGVFGHAAYATGSAARWCGRRVSPCAARARGVAPLLGEREARRGAER